MAISSDTRKAGPFSGNDVTTAFPFAFKVFEAADLRVVHTDVDGVEVDLVLGSDFSVELNFDQDNDPGGTVTLVTAPADGEKLTITSDVPARQPLVLTNNGGFYPRVINDAFDRITIIAQQLIEQMGRTIRLPISSTASAQLPEPQANAVLTWNSTADGFTNVSLNDLATVSGYADARVEVYEGDGAKTQFAVDFNPGVLANLDIAVGGVTQTAGVDFTWSGTTVTFAEAPPDGATVQIRYARPIAPIPNYDGYLEAAEEVFAFRDTVEDSATFRAAIGAVGTTALAAAGGSAMVGYIGLGTGAEAQTLQAYLRSLAVNFASWNPVANGTFDNAEKLQAAVNYAASVNKALYIPPALLDYRINSEVTVPSTVTIFSDGKNRAKIIAVGCNGFVIDAGTNDVVIKGMTIAAGTRHTDTPHSFSAIVVNGTELEPCYRLRFEDLLFDGFQYGLLANFMCSSVLDYQTVYGFSGFWIKGRSVNNTARGSCRFNGVDSTLTAPQAGSVGWRVGDGTLPQPEGLTVEPGMVCFGFERGFRVQGAIYVNAIGGLYDAISSIGVIEESSDTAPSFGNTIALNRFLFSQAGDYLYFHNSTATAFRNDNMGTMFLNNSAQIYSGATLLYGIYVNGAFAEGIRVVGLSRVRGAGPSDALIDTTVRDVLIAGGKNHALKDCQFNASTGVEITATELVEYQGNTGRLAIGLDKIFHTDGTSRVTYGAAAPSSGAAAVGDRHINTAPAASGNIGWVCVTAGSPGTWKAYGAIEA